VTADVVIVGSGIAGLSADGAALLVRSGTEEIRAQHVLEPLQSTVATRT